MGHRIDQDTDGPPRPRGSADWDAIRLPDDPTRAELVEAVRTLVAASSCFLDRADTSLKSDQGRADKLRGIVAELKALADQQHEEARGVVATVLCDYLTLIHHLQPEYRAVDLAYDALSDADREVEAAGREPDRRAAAEQARAEAQRRVHDAIAAVRRAEDRHFTRESDSGTPRLAARTTRSGGRLPAAVLLEIDRLKAANRPAHWNDDGTRGEPEPIVDAIRGGAFYFHLCTSGEARLLTVDAARNYATMIDFHFHQGGQGPYAAVAVAVLAMCELGVPDCELPASAPPRSRPREEQRPKGLGGEIKLSASATAQLEKARALREAAATALPAARQPSARNVARASAKKMNEWVKLRRHADRTTDVTNQRIQQEWQDHGIASIVFDALGLPLPTPPRERVSSADNIIDLGEFFGAAPGARGLSAARLMAEVAGGGEEVARTIVAADAVAWPGRWVAAARGLTRSDALEKISRNLQCYGAHLAAEGVRRNAGSEPPSDKR